ncbi:MAG TPA: PDR/VanB family oxidoreductase [Methylibium sp.]|nr:PDR/VanB family oxidoreductase [Methylibium sp.]
MSITKPPPRSLLRLEVAGLRSEAKGVVALELRHPLGETLPAFDPGAHLEVHLPNGLVRHYSLSNSPAERDRYCIGVGLAPNSRGGSSFVHESIRRGDRLLVSAPRNHFPLVTDAQAYCFVAGGIGITPLLSMIRWCIEHGKSWRLHYCVRSRQRAAFWEELQSFDGAQEGLRLHADDEQAGRRFDPREALLGLAADAPLYCCGPASLMSAVESATQQRPAGTVHFEWFAAKSAPAVEQRAFTVKLRSSGLALDVGPGQTVLGVLEQHGVPVPASCREGSCGTCQTGVVAGVPDHRDSVLSAQQRAANDCMMVCVSRARSEALVLDL